MHPSRDAAAGRAGTAAPRVESIWIADRAGASPRQVSDAEARPGVGIVGDRYARGAGSWQTPGRWSEVTLVAAEAVEEAARTLGVSLAPESLRRNLVTRGAQLGRLIGVRFRVGEAVLEGERPCTPCRPLSEALGVPELYQVLDGGLRARVIRAGTLRPGPIEVLEAVGSADARTAPTS